jgi:general secretion pathway protein A
MNKKLLTLFGLKWNPFATEVPFEGLLVTARIESFCFRIENGLAREGGFAQLDGSAGTGKSVMLRILADRLGKLRDVNVGPLTHPTSGLADFYRELGELFEIEGLKPHNRWGGFKALRAKWQEHIKKTLVRPIVLIDEAQDMRVEVLRELRLLTSAEYDSKNLLSVVLAGDANLVELLRRPELAPLASRIRTRLSVDGAENEDLLACLKHACAAAGNAKLITADLAKALVEHAVGNYRTLMQHANELLIAGAEREASQLDEKLFFEIFQPASTEKGSRTPAPAKRR